VQPYRAVVAGATGAVGSALVRELLASPLCTRVLALTRRPVTLFADTPGRAKLTLAVIDYAHLEAETAARAAGFEAAFCTVGIGQPRKVSSEEFWRVDVEYAGAFARGAAHAGARHLSLLSAIGANAASGNRYIRTKGKAEEAVIAAGVPRTTIFRPSVLATDEIRYGLQDRLTQSLFPLVAPLLPRKLHHIHVNDLGRAMRRNAEKTAPPGVEYRYYPEYVALLHG
jgi:uncharacterized protein YbjT (DUF2867 family)